MKRASLARLKTALEAKKMRDAARLAKTQAELNRIDARIHDIETALAQGPGSTPVADFSEWRAIDNWSNASREEIAALVEQRAKVDAYAAELRKPLARSNGEVEAVKHLLKTLKPTRRR